MTIQLKNTSFFIFLFLLNFFCAKGQREYFVTVDPTTGTFTKLDSIPGVNWIIGAPTYITFDKNNHRYFFAGGSDRINWQLFAIDANTGSVLSNPPLLPLTDPYDNLIELQYDNSSNTLYGLHWDNSQSTEFLVTVDPLTGTFAIVDSLPGVRSIAVMPNFTTFDEVNHLYIFYGSDQAGTLKLFSVDVNTGGIIYSPSFPAFSNSGDNLVGLQLDGPLNILYGLHWNSTLHREYISLVDPIGGHSFDIDSLPGVKSTATIISNTIDDIHHRYIFVGYDTNNDTRLYTVDVVNGQILSSPLFQAPVNNQDNILGLRYDSSTDIYYALRWETGSSVGLPENIAGNNEFNISPNPVSHSANIELNKSYRDIEVFIYNSTGQVLKKQTANNSDKIKLKTDNLSNGIYFVSVVCNQQIIGIKKIIVE